MSDMTDYSFDATSVALLVSTLVGFLPPIAALLSIVWMIIRILETCTMRAWVANRKGLPFSRTDCLRKELE